MNSIFIVLPILTVLMFDLGLNLTLQDISYVFKRPKAMFVGLFGQLVILPLIAFSIGSVLGLTPALFIGLMLIACCPGGSSSNIFSMLAKGDVALSVSLTAISSFVTLLTIPVIMQYVTAYVGTAVGIKLPVVKLVNQIIFTTLLPIVIGMVLKHYKPGIASAIEKRLSKLAFPLLMLLAGIFFIQNRQAIIDNFNILGLSTSMLIMISCLIATLIGIIFKLKKNEKRTIFIEVGMQNAAQAIAIGSSPFVFNNPEIATPGIIYALLMNVILLSYVGVIRLLHR